MLVDEDLNSRGTMWTQEFPYAAYRESSSAPSTCTGSDARCAAVVRAHRTGHRAVLRANTSFQRPFRNSKCGGRKSAH
jgi:hypothetical protein